MKILQNLILLLVVALHPLFLCAFFRLCLCRCCLEFLSLLDWPAIFMLLRQAFSVITFFVSPFCLTFIRRQVCSSFFNASSRQSPDNHAHHTHSQKASPTTQVTEDANHAIIFAAMSLVHPTRHPYLYQFPLDPSPYYTCSLDSCSIYPSRLDLFDALIQFTISKRSLFDGYIWQPL